MRIASLLLSLGVAIGAAVALGVPQQAPDALGFSALNQSPPNAPMAVLLFQKALRQDASNPYRWADLGFAYQNAQDLDEARRCFARAIELSGSLPAIWLRDANFHFTLGENDEALESAARVLKTVPDYDDLLFGYFDRFNLSPQEVLERIGGDRRATQAYTRHILAASRPAETALAWRFAFSRKFVDGPLADAYVDALLRLHRYREAQVDWAEYVGKAGGDYPARNRLFNGSFETPPSGSAFDWQIAPSQDFDTVRDDTGAHEGKWSLRIQFHGTGNVSYENVIQKTVLEPGRYTLQAWIRSDQITTNECPHLEVSDADSSARLNVTSESFCGSSDWRPVSVTFTIAPGTRLIGVKIVRRPSQKFDNKINGVVWIDAVRIFPE